jgi:histidine phosphotransferase ChpT
LMSARFCHDLAGPVGAISNGIDFVTEGDADTRARAVELIETSAAQAVVRLQFFRQLFGAIAEGMPASVAGLREICAKFFSHTKVALKWSDEISQLELTAREGKILLNCVYLASTVLIMGGIVTISLEKDGILRITSIGKKTKISPDISRILEGKASEEEIDTKNVNIFYIKKMIKLTKKKLIVDSLEKEGSFSIAFNIS